MGAAQGEPGLPGFPVGNRSGCLSIATPVLTRTRLAVLVAIVIATTGNRAFFSHVAEV